MHKARIRLILMIVSLSLAFCVVNGAHAELRDAQMFRPIEWEESMTSSKTVHFSWANPASSVTLAGTPASNGFDRLKNIFGLQVSRTLNRQWKGRVGLLFSGAGTQRGDALWSFVGSDLQHSLIPTSWTDKTIFRRLRPLGYFGLGFASRWQNSQVRYTLLPTFRYDESEPAAYLGISTLLHAFGDVIFEIDVRYFQSARDSRNTFLSFGGSLVLGRWATL